MNQSRITFIDVFRGGGILLMVMGHIGFGGMFDKFIHAFHMPMFFFVSGYFYHSKIMSINDYCIKKSKTLLIPYVTTGIICLFVWLILNRNSMSLGPLLHLLSINTEGLPIAGALWFLTAMFICNVLYAYLDNKITKRLSFVVACIALLGNLLPGIMGGHRLPWAADTALVGIGLYHTARILKTYENKIPVKIFDLKPIWLLMIGICTSVSIFVNGYINLRAGSYAIIPLFWVNAIAASLVGWSLSKYIDNSTGTILKLLARWLRYVGKNSLVYLCWNQMIILLVMKLDTPLRSLGVHIAISHFIILLITMLVLWGVNYIFANTQAKRLLGK